LRKLLIVCLLLSLIACNSQTPPKQKSKLNVSKVESIGAKSDAGADIALNGIIYDEGQSLAIINGQIYYQGDFIGQNQIIDIASDYVRFKAKDSEDHSIVRLSSDHKEVSDQKYSKEKSVKKEESRQYLFAKAKLIDTEDYLIFIPEKTNFNDTYPLIVFFTPDADTKGTLKHFKDLAQKYKWLLFISKEFHIGVDMAKVITDLALTIESLSESLPIDKSKIIVSGFSAGAMGAHFFSYAEPKLISAIIINSGTIHQDLKGVVTGHPKSKRVVFLASPTDYGYKSMLEDKRFLDSLGWKTKWIEFKGGHRLAPKDIYEKAFAWLKIQFRE